MGGEQLSTLNKYSKSNFVEDKEKKYGNIKREYNSDSVSLWSDWSSPSECESGCLYGESGRLRAGSAGLKVYTRTCLDYRFVLVSTFCIFFFNNILRSVDIPEKNVPNSIRNMSHAAQNRYIVCIHFKFILY